MMFPTIDQMKFSATSSTIRYVRIFDPFYIIFRWYLKTILYSFLIMMIVLHLLLHHPTCILYRPLSLSLSLSLVLVFSCALEFLIDRRNCFKRCVTVHHDGLMDDEDDEDDEDDDDVINKIREACLMMYYFIY